MRVPCIPLVLCCAFILACEDNAPTGPEDGNTALFKPKCETPPCKGGDPPPPPTVGDPAILFSSAMEGNVGGGGCKRGDLHWSVYRMDTDGLYERVFPDALEIQSASLYPSFAPDGQQFAFYRDVYTVAKGRCATEHFHIATAGVDGTGFQIIREIERGVGGLDQPRWSPGPVGGVERIGWLEWVEDFALMTVVIANTDGSNANVVVSGTADYEVEGFEWSRSGDAVLVYFRGWEAVDSYLRLYSLDCSVSCTTASSLVIGNLSPITPDKWFGEMDWARQHDWVAVPACGGGNCDLYKIDLSNPVSPAVTQLTANGLDEGEVSWSPDDSMLLFTAWAIDGTRKALELDLSVATLPWNGDVSAPGIRVLAEVGNSWGLDRRRF